MSSWLNYRGASAAANRASARDFEKSAFSCASVPAAFSQPSTCVSSHPAPHEPPLARRASGKHGKAIRRLPHHESRTRQKPSSHGKWRFGCRRDGSEPLRQFTNHRAAADSDCSERPAPRPTGRKCQSEPAQAASSLPLRCLGKTIGITSIDASIRTCRSAGQGEGAPGWLDAPPIPGIRSMRTGT